MCALKSPMSQVTLNTSVMAITDKSDPLTNFFLGWGGGGGGGLRTSLLRRLSSRKNRFSCAISS